MRETIVDRAYAKTLLPPRKEDGHKGDFGKLLVLGGSVGYTGAPYLAASAAVHSGCGLVYLGVPESIWAVEAQKCVSAMPFPLPETDGRLCLAALDRMQDKLKGCDVLALGPGLGRGKETEQLVHALLWQVKEPLVLDADGLNALQGCTEKLDVRRGRVTILTPHDGEFARLTDRTLREIASSERTELASRFACEHGCILVLKGHRTRIALPDGRMLVNTSGCSALSKGGSGDVLTGLIASLLCQGVGAAEAAALGAGLDVEAPEGNMVIDIGGGTSEIACISLGGIVCSESINTAGDVFTNDIQSYVRQQHNIRIGERTAEAIKCSIGAAVSDLDEEPEDFVVTGPNMLTALPQTVSLSYSEIAYALEKSLTKIDAALMKVLESMPPELYADIVKNGIYLAGGGALIKGLDRRLNEKTGIPFHIAEDPLRAIARGTGIALKNINRFSFLMK